MSEESQRPLTRRELRLREGWAAQDSVDTDREVAESAPETDSFPGVGSFGSEAHPTTTSSIPVIGPDGQLLTRRQLRELWAAEEAAAAAATADVPQADVPDVLPAEAQQVETPATAPAESHSESLERAGVAEESAPEEAAPTPVKVSASEADEDTLEAAVSGQAAETIEEPITSQPPKKLRFPWSRGSAEPSEVGGENLDGVPESSESLEPAGETGPASGQIAAAATAGLIASELLETEEPDTHGLAETDVETEPEQEVDSAPASVTETQGDESSRDTADLHAEQDQPTVSDVLDDTDEGATEQGSEAAEVEPEVEPYSFPEVSPEPEARSIFDRPDFMQGEQPSSDQQPAASGAFDDIIERAVADEGAASPTTTAALILPVMPDTTDLTGALNETGEIVITGSIELPRALGETGGHQGLHDALDAHEAAVLGHDVHELSLDPQNDSQPVAASQAISAQSVSTALVGAQPERKRKLPLILAITAGSLTVVVAGVFVWAASTGLFG